MGGGDPPGQGGPRAFGVTSSLALLAFAAGAIIAVPLIGLFAHRLRSGPASVVAGFGFAATLAGLGFARSLETRPRPLSS